MLFTQDNKIEPAELARLEATQTKKPLENVKMPPLLTQMPSQSPPLVDAPDAPHSPPPRPRKDTGNTACLVSEINLRIDRPMVADDMLFSVYQDCVHQNPDTHYELI